MSGPPEILYHYTSMEALKGIISENRVWMTDCRYCNDSHELTTYWNNTVAYAQANIEKYPWVTEDWKDWCQEQIDDYVFGVFCLSATPERLSQWVRYADDGRGVCLGFRIPAESRVKLEEVDYKPTCETVCDDRILTVSRNREGYAKKDGSARMLLAKYLCRIKNEAFHEEEEWRYIVTTRKEDADFRQSSGKFVPFIKTNPFLQPKLPLKEIWLGPKTNDNDRNAVLAFLKKHTYAPKTRKYDCGYQ